MKSNVDLSSLEYQSSLQEALANCAREPIHQIGSIQPNGVLIAVDPELWIIRAVSANVSRLLPTSIMSALGQPLDKILGPGPAGQIRTLAQGCGDSSASIGSVTLFLGRRALTLDFQVFRTQVDVVVEIELESPPGGDVFHKLFVPIRDALWRLDAEQDMLRYASAVVGQVRLLTGFDRVMMYRFDENWDGEVIAESKTEDSNSYLGNHFPASDIPAQARQLYTINLVRLLSDIHADQIPMLVDSVTQPPVDLSLSWLRSMSPIHVEYLRNMGVRASLSISLVQNGRLWGLIACHHFSPKYVSIRERELNELIGRTVSLKLIYMDNAERAAINSKVRDLLFRFTEGINHSEDVHAAILAFRDELLGVVRATGCIVAIGGVQHQFGELPRATAIERLLAKLRTLPPAPLFRTECLADYCAEMEEFRDIASGILAVPLDHLMRDFVMWFRPGVTRTLRWAGPPQKKVVAHGNVLRISPRESFETWIETYGDKCAAWSQVEIDAVNSMSLAIIKILTQQALRSQEESYRLVAENSTDMIASLSLDGRFRFVSPVSFELLGSEPTNLLGKSLLEFIVDEDRPNLLDALEELRQTGAQTTILVRANSAKRKDFWLEATMKRVLGVRGVEEIVMNARDVTQRHTYQLAIEDVHRRNTRILDASGDGLISLDLNGKIVYANELALRWLGLDETQVIGSDCCELLCSPDSGSADPTPVDCPFMGTLADGETRQGGLSPHAGNKHLTTRTNYLCSPLRDGETITGCIIVLSEAAPQEPGNQAQHAQVILEQAAEAVMVTNASGRIQSVNRAFTEITGYSAEEALGQTPRLLRSGVHTPNFYDEFWRTLGAEHCWRGEIWNKRKNGEIYPQWGSVTAVLDSAGNAKNYVAVFSDISKAKQAEDKLQYLASHDTLTGLPNRAMFSEQLGRAIDRARRNESTIAVVFVDLDHFKAINDTLGHSVGDVYLKRITERLMSVTRKDDILARWGGDEFVFALKDIANRAVLVETMLRVLGRLAEPLMLNGHELVPQASLGVSVYPEDGLIPGDLIKAADAAMYRAKHHGRNGFAFYTQEMQAALDDRFKLAIEIRRALAEGEFRLYFQPQVHAQNGHLVGVEALVRWQHPTRGLLAPGYFIPLAEEIGLICELGDWVLKEACQQKRRWLNGKVNVNRLAVNVSPLQLKRSFVDTVARCIRESELDPGCLELEITEGILVGGDTTRKILVELRELGVLLSIDDFGTGYSSLANIRNFPITCFKIDKSFIDGLPHEAQDFTIVQTILALGSNMRVEIVAEGVETQEQVDCLRSTGVTHLQGYFFGRPMPADELAELIRIDAFQA